ncbi:MAG: hypothetical protein KGH58_01235 [Candidatus Micrarchaeota archaeon]|nr:hypothetical protein [Candidatus Micrarchaeota archaeon]
MMGFYGLLVGITLLISLSGLAALLHGASQLNAVAYQYSYYDNIVLASAFSRAVSITAVNSSDPAYGSWIQSVMASAYLDGINVRFLNGSIAVSSSARPYAAYVVGINNT